MSQFLSPYALLCASKPKPPRCVTSQYDLYSLSQETDAPCTAERSSHIPAAPIQPEQSTPAHAAPAKKTHYISDIHARHANAMRRTPQSPV